MLHIHNLLRCRATPSLIQGHATLRCIGSYRGIGKRGLDVHHSKFLADKPGSAKWLNDKESFIHGNGDDADELEGVHEGKGKLAPTSSHLFKLILPLGKIQHKKPQSHNSTKEPKNHKLSIPPPTVFLLHPAQPLSHVSRLILKTLAPHIPDISFRSISLGGQVFQWSESTDIGDFIRDVARAAEFRVVMTHHGDASMISNEGSNNQEILKKKIDGKEKDTEIVLRVQVPTFAARTQFLRRRLDVIEKRIGDMKVIKSECDRDAHRDAERLAIGGFAMLVVYWAAVARLTFWDFGWDIMEPITYLSGLTTVVLGYLWFLYQGKEVSYSSVLDRSISSRREALYHVRGFDLELWRELIAERKDLIREIGRIAEDYNESQSQKSDEKQNDEKGEVGIPTED